jgi:inorganic pyrophosphatase
VIYPQDYGFIPGTLADDDDPLDILVLISHPTYPRTLVECKPIGVLVMEDEKGIDYKVLAVAVDDPSYNTGYDDVVQLPHHCLDEIKEFFRTYKNLENPKYSAVKEWRGRDYAYKVIEESIDAFKRKYGDIAKIDPIADPDVDS